MDPSRERISNQKRRDRIGLAALKHSPVCKVHPKKEKSAQQTFYLLTFALMGDPFTAALTLFKTLITAQPEKGRTMPKIKGL
jgi:hypothetical protein